MHPTISIQSIRSVAFAAILYFVYISLFLMPFPEIGHSMALARWQNVDTESLFYRDVTLFNGVTWHSQILGPCLALLNAFVISELLRKPSQYRIFYLVTLAVIPFIIFATDSRTGFISYGFSIFFALFWQGWIKNRNNLENKQRRIIIYTLAFFIPIYLFALGGLVQIHNFLRKGAGHNLTIIESLQNTRLRMADHGFQNFLESPILGNGFQVARNMENLGNQELGLIFSAPIEKGFLPTMILEETGISGFFIFSIFIISVFKSSLHFGCLRFLSCFTTFLVLNSGEAVFFSVSGAGGIYWIFCTLALAIDMKEWQGQQINHYRVA